MKALLYALLALGVGIVIGGSCRKEVDVIVPVPVPVPTPTPAPTPRPDCDKPDTNKVTNDDKLPLPSILDFPPVVNPKAPSTCTDGSCAVTPPARPELGPVKTYQQPVYSGSCSNGSCSTYSSGSGHWERGRFGRLWYVQD